MSPGDRSNIQFQPRDLALLCGLFESRIMTLAHAALLHFDGKREMAKKRIQKLKSAGVIRERPRRFADPSILFLTRKGFQILRDRGRLAGYPAVGPRDFEKRTQVSELTLRHELQVMDVKAVILAFLRKTSLFKLDEFLTWPTLYQFKACRSNGEMVVLKPDGFLRIENNDAGGGHFEQAFFLELDRGTETLSRLVEKCICYRDFQLTGGYAKSRGGTREEYKSYPFRVLFVCESIERSANLADQLLNIRVPFSKMILITTFAQLVTNAAGKIWTTPAARKKPFEDFEYLAEEIDG